MIVYCIRTEVLTQVEHPELLQPFLGDKDDRGA
jgi:hypothetical protein